MFELLRKFFLLLVLFVVVMGSYLTARNSTDWREPLWVQMYPINADNRQATARYIDSLSVKNFASIEDFMRREADRYGVEIQRPVKIIYGNQLNEIPPVLPDNPGVLNIMLWSLKLRWWAGSVTSDQPGPQPDIRMFLVYHDPEASPVLKHSMGLEKGMIGVINVFASPTQAQTNNFIIAHEMLHTLGATDKYAPGSNLPVFPQGFAEPDKQPLYPQTRAELMGGRIPLSQAEATIPSSLKQAVIGPATAKEIRWIN